MLHSGQITSPTLCYAIISISFLLFFLYGLHYHFSAASGSLLPIQRCPSACWWPSLLILFCRLEFQQHLHCSFTWCASVRWSLLRNNRFRTAQHLQTQIGWWCKDNFPLSCKWFCIFFQSIRPFRQEYQGMCTFLLYSFITNSLCSLPISYPIRLKDLCRNT